MGRSLHLTGLVVALVTGGFASGGPVLRLEPATYGWGRQVENKGEYAFTFTVTNAGDEELRIARVRPACSCTKVELKKQNLAPGESTQMTGVLTTKGTEGTMRKGIILSSNDPLHDTTVATLEIRFPLDCQGVRIRGTPVMAVLRQEALWAHVVVENCDPEQPAQVLAVELPEGWRCAQSLPVRIQPEERVSVSLTKTVNGTAAPAPFGNVAFTLVTDSPQSLRVQGTIAYRPDGTATVISAPGTPLALGGSKAPVRWPLSRPAPVVAPVVSLPSGPRVAPATAPGAAAGTAAAAPAATSPATPTPAATAPAPAAP